MQQDGKLLALFISGLGSILVGSVWVGFIEAPGALVVICAPLFVVSSVPIYVALSMSDA